jgi:CPA1 family monovalent cation:H+ antiporter
VLAVLACGLLMTRHWGSISSGARLQARQLWDWLVFVLEGLSFVLVGVQLRTVVEGIEGRSLADLALAALLLNLVVIVVRLAWVYPASWLPRLSARVRERDPFPGWASVTVIGWAGMRGVVTLALALAIPTRVEDGSPFPDRNLVVFLAFSVIVVTLVGQGLTLPLVIRRLGVAPDDEGTAADGRRALARLSEVALDHLDGLDPESDGVPGELVERLRQRYRSRLAHLDRAPSGRSFAASRSGAWSPPRWRAASTTTWTWRRRAWSVSAPPDSRGPGGVWRGEDHGTGAFGGPWGERAPPTWTGDCLSKCCR